MEVDLLGNIVVSIFCPEIPIDIQEREKGRGEGEKKLEETYMVNNLVGNTAVVLQDVKVLRTRDLGDFLCDGLFGAFMSVSSICM